MPDYFSVPIFFIVFRETIEAAIIVGVLLSFVEQLMTTGRRSQPIDSQESTQVDLQHGATVDEEEKKRTAKLLRRMRLQIWAGTLTGFFLALCIGAAFIAVFYTKLVDLWAQTEQIWEGVFSAVASVIIMVMGIAFLKMDKSRVKWRLKLADAFEKSHSKAMRASEEGGLVQREEGRSGKWALFLLPFITVVREGLEAVVFVGGVSLGIPAVSIPIAVIVGLIAGAIVGYLIYKTGTSSTLHWFLVGSTTILFLIGAGLFSKAIGYFEYYTFAKGVGGDVAETGDGPGSYRVAGNVWHLTYGNPETGSPTTNGGWQIFNAILGWNNSASLGTILGYVFYWLFLIGVLLDLKWQEGRLSVAGRGSAAYNRRMGKRAAAGESLGPQTSYSDSAETPSDEEKEKDLVGH